MKIYTRIVIIASLLSFVASAGYAQLSASFTASSIAGCSPLVVNFTNTTTPLSGTTFSWNLGLGGTDPTSLNASSSYITPGTYTITLTATNGGHTSTYSMTVTVYPSPTVSFNANDTAVCPGTTITFTSTSVGGVPGPVTCAWSFGDGYAGTGTVTTHTYTSAGWYTVILTATNNDGCQNALTKPSYIHVFTPPVAGFSAPTYYCNAPATVTFSNTSTGAGPMTYDWTFGDGGSSTVINPTHTYSATGSYTVTLIVTDADGCKDTLTIPAYITLANPHAAFSGPATSCVYSAVTFTDLSSTHSTATWYYGDGGSSSGDPGVHTYSTPGTYTVELITFDGHCSDTATHTITIIPGPVTSFTYSPMEPCPPPSAITFTGSAPSGTTVPWIYGDGSAPGSGITSTHTYGAAGTYTVDMVSVDPSTGCRDTVSETVTVYGLYPIATASPDEGCKPLPVTFGVTAYTTPGGPVVYPYSISSYSWTFGDGTSGTGASPSHTYTAVGTYWAIVTIVTSNGCTAEDSVKILVGAPPVVTFTVKPLNQCYHNNVDTFTVTIISGPVDSLFWSFGDTSRVLTTDTVSETHHYDTPGYYVVTVIPYYHGCPGPPYVFPDSIVIDSPMAIISDRVPCSPANTVILGDSSLGDNSHLWMYGDGGASTLSDVTHTYASTGIYTVTLTTYNSRSGCRDTATQIINLERPVPIFTAPDSLICAGASVVLTATYTGGGSVTSYSWSSPGGTFTGTGPTITDLFATRGIYAVSLNVTDQNGCTETSATIIHIRVAKPDVSLTATPASGCAPLTVTFTDASTDIAGISLVSYAWTFGDGTSATVTTHTETHTYHSGGSFTATEIVTDIHGCTDTGSFSPISVDQPSASFTCSNVNPCVFDSTQLVNTSTGIVGSFWIFGDGTTSTATSPWHTYTSPGIYTVSLVVTDSHGCTDTATNVHYINANRPAASFYMTDSVSVCPPLAVNFVNTSTGGIFNNWWLGSGITSVLVSPSQLYVTTGEDTIMLVVSNTFGCRDTAIGHVTIFGYQGEFTYGPSYKGCSPMTVTFHATTLNVPNIIWDFADGTTSSVSYTDSVSHVYVQPGAYVPKLILSEGSGCENSSVGVDTIYIDQVTASFRSIPNPICVGESFILVDSSQSFWSTITGLSWTFNGVSSTADTPTYTINIAGTYPAVLIATDGWGCAATVNIDETIFPLPVITASPDTTVCVSDAATLTGYGGVSYTWSPPVNLSCTNCNPSMASPTVITTYTVTGIDVHGCINTDTTTVFLRTNTTAVAWGDTNVCYGIPVPLFDSGGTKYTWIPGTGLNDPHIADPIATPGTTTRYMAIAQLADCIPDTNEVYVNVYPLPTVDAGPDQTVVAGATAQINATGTYIAKYLWDNAQSLSCDSCSSPIASMSVTTTYFINVTSEHGCTASDSVTIYVHCENSQVFVPNAFTPNHDGKDDVFYPRGEGISKIKTFRIYNRWGELLFERTNININDETNAWDGTYDGNSPRPDVYVWIIEAECEAGQQLNLKGDVTIIR